MDEACYNRGMVFDLFNFTVSHVKTGSMTVVASGCDGSCR